MNKSILTALAVSTLFALVHGQNPHERKPTGQERPAPGVNPHAPQDARIWMNDDVIGMGVVSTTGQRVGKIEDLVIQPDGRAAYAVLSFDEGMGFGAKQFIVPWTTLRSSSPEGNQPTRLVLPLDKERLASAPSFDRGKLPVMNVEDWPRDIDEFYGSERTKEGEAAPPGARTFLPPVKFSELSSLSVETSAGEKIGDVKRVAFDPSGRVGYTVVSVSSPGAPTRLLAIPLDAMQVAHDPADPKAKPRLLIAMDKSRLVNAPVFDEEKRHDRIWLGTVYEFYSRPPYWQTQGSSIRESPGGDRPEGSKP